MIIDSMECLKLTQKDVKAIAWNSIQGEKKSVFEQSHYWCLVCRQRKPRKSGVFCLSYFGNFYCEHCKKEKEDPESTKLMMTVRENPNLQCFSCGTNLRIGWAKGLCLCKKCKETFRILKEKKEPSRSPFHMISGGNPCSSSAGPECDDVKQD
ncbi:hypothetical protein TNIN_239991 [Trichonephila inaurata madagascariensis]|uniref:Uncharacterized protein n=1 Tax=Trichonephila inaurata madagascariensis TaxID=2747483 RepID=A0A8X6XBI6_9ARAC|nr:hypothetical protein TNIN_239991 [Trichonephila inaurata madagascariensis]